MGKNLRSLLYFVILAVFVFGTIRYLDNSHEELRLLEQFNTKLQSIATNYENVAKMLESLEASNNNVDTTELLRWYIIWSELDNEKTALFEKVRIKDIDKDHTPILVYMSNGDCVKELDKLVADFELAEKQLREILKKK